MKLKSFLLVGTALVPFATTTALANDASFTAPTTTPTYVTIGDNNGSFEFTETYTITDNTSTSTVATSLNTSGSSATTVGNTSAGTTVVGSSIVVNGGSGASEVTVGAGTITTLGILSQTGTTNINTSGTRASTIGTDGNATSILSTTVSIGNATNATSISMGNTVSGTVISAEAGNTSTEMGDDRIRNTITDTNVSAGTVVANNGAARWVADENGKLNEVANTDTTSGTTAAMVVTNSAGNTHGIVVQEEKTVVSGGTSSSSLTLADNGATFSNSATGRPIQVHGVADGTADFDATNVRQVYSGLAAVLAATPELRLEPGKTGAGIGLGSYGGFHAVGFGLGHMYDNGAVLTVSAGKASHSKVAYKAGLSWSW